MMQVNFLLMSLNLKVFVKWSEIVEMIYILLKYMFCNVKT